MTLERRFADEMIRKHPGRAATALERLGVTEAARLLGNGDVSRVGEVVRRLSPQFGARVLQEFGLDRSAAVVKAIPIDAAVRLLRRVDEDLRAALLESLPPDRARRVRASLRFAEGSAGALMDPDVLALPQELMARDALRRVREAAEHVRYNVYVVDQEHRLVGVMNLRELLVAPGRTPISDLMVRDPLRLVATAGSASVLAHPGWDEVHALPVVDEAGVYLGAIRYKTLHMLRQRSERSLESVYQTSAALGEMIGAAIAGLLEAIGGTAPRSNGGRHGA